MPTLPVPLFSPVYRNVDEEELSDESYELVDGYLDELGFTVKRPGMDLLLDLGLGSNHPIEGLFWWPQKSLGLAVCNNKIYKLTYPSGTLTATDITTNGPGSASQPVFAVGVDSNVSAPVLYGIVAAGGIMTESHGTTNATSNFTTIADAQAPTMVSHVDFIDGYLVATTGKSMFQYSDVNAPLSWSALSFATAMRNPDTLKALKVFRRQIFLIGQVTTEVWENDGTTPFAPTPGGFFEVGTNSPNSVTVSDDGIYWLGHDRHFVGVMNGAIQKISTPYDKEIQGFSSVSDCLGYRIEIRGKPFLIFQFPTAERTLVYNVDEKNWQEWRYWDSAYGEYKHFIGKSYAYSPEWGLHLVGSRIDSKIYAFTPDAKDDDGTTIRFKKVTGHIDYGTTARKRSKRLRIRAKRGEGLNGGEATLMLRWNDDNRGWSNEVHLSLGSIGETETVIQCEPRGIYRTRQYEIVVTDSVGISFGRAEEEFDVLGR